VILRIVPGRSATFLSFSGNITAQKQLCGCVSFYSRHNHDKRLKKGIGPREHQNSENFLVYIAK
jgi:hypothetical protein